MEKTEAPTEERLAELRAKGIVPYSGFSTRCVATVALLLSLFAVRSELRGILVFYRARVASTGALNMEALKEFSPILSQLIPLFCIPVVSVIVATFAWGLVQTKFLLVFSQLGLQPGRMRKEIFPGLSGLLGGIFGSLFGAVVAVGVALGAAYASSYAAAELLALGPRSTAPWASRIFASVSPLLVMVLFSLAIISWLIARARFSREHRMTRKEVERGVE